MIIHQGVVKFLHAALECSIYVSPTDPGLTFSELAEAARRADFLEGEINDSIPHVAMQTFGPRNRKVQLDKQQAVMLQMFHVMEEPDYRNPAAFHGVFTVMRQVTRELGIANAHIERPALVEKVINDLVTENDVQIAIAILILNEILCDKDGIVSFTRGKESYGSPGDHGNLQVIRMGSMRKDARARAYPIVKKVIEDRNSPTLPAEAKRLGQSNLASENQSNDEWLNAAASLDLLGRGYLAGTTAICKRAHAGLIKARAKRFFRDNRQTDGVEVPTEFWWAEGGAALKQDWSAGDFDTWIDRKIHLKVFGVEFRRSDIEDMRETPDEKASVKGGKVFLGHGRSSAWRELKDFLQDRLRLDVEEFNSVAMAGVPTAVRLQDMLNNAVFAFMILTAEDAEPDGTVRARLNVIHETGLFQGRLGFKKAIVLLENGCEVFSNIDGLGQIRFPKDGISTAFEQVRAVLEREQVIPQT